MNCKSCKDLVLIGFVCSIYSLAVTADQVSDTFIY